MVGGEIMLTFLMTIDDPVKRSKLETIYMTYYQEIYAHAYHILKDESSAEDIVQDVIIRVSKDLDKVDEKNHVKTKVYLVTIARNLSFNVYNRRRRTVLFEHEKLKYIEDDGELIEEEYLKKELANEMAVYLNELYAPYADVLVLKYIYELKSKQIAELIDIEGWRKCFEK